jgi:hypothetical protein
MDVREMSMDDCDLTDEEEAVALMARIDACRTSRRIHGKVEDMLNGKLSKFLTGWSGFKWVDGSKVEYRRLAAEGSKGVDLCAKLLVHSWVPDIRQRPSQVAAILVDAVADALRAMPREELDRIGALMRAQLEV